LRFSQEFLVCDVDQSPRHAAQHHAVSSTIDANTVTTASSRVGSGTFPEFRDADVAQVPERNGFHRRSRARSRQGGVTRRRNQGVFGMPGWAVTFLLVALVAAFLGFGGVAAFAVDAARIIFFVAIVLFAVSAIVALIRGRAPTAP
jgi:uncharacterized membrane protein YtjA (UPF0391 family)